WTGAPGTAAGGSHTTPARPISETTLTIELPVTVLAFNLGKTVTVTYTVTRNGAPRTSLPLLLNVGTLPDSSLILPVIMDADDDGEGPEFNVGNLTSNATYRMGVWPLIATGQYVWLRLKGTNADGSDYNLQIHTAPGSMVSDKWLEQGYYERSIAFAGLRNLKDGSPLTMEFKAAFGKSMNESEAVVFPVRTYTIKAFEDVRPEITESKDSKGNEIAKGGFTVDTQITLSGAGAKGQKVQIKDGTTVKGEATVNLTTGLWELTLTGLSVAAHSFTAIALYGSGQVSAAWTLTVTASNPPTITSVKDQSNWNIPDNGHTVHTSVTLTGSAPDGQKVEVFLGAISKGIAEAGPDRTWTRTVSGLSLDVLHTLKAVGQYANNPTSNLWRLTALNGVRPAITAAQDSNGQPISNGGSTPDTRIRLTGTANTFLEVEIHDGATSTGKKARADDKGIWTVELTGLTPTKHVFKAKALYGSGTESGEWILNVVDLVDLVEDFQSYPEAQATNPREFFEGTNTKVTLNATLGGAHPDHSVLVPTDSRRVLRACSFTRTSQNLLAYSLALKQGRAKSATISGLYIGFERGHIKLELLQDNLVVESIVLFEGDGNGSHIPIDKEIAPLNGQAFDTLKFEFKVITSEEHITWFDIKTVTFKT
ncbi:hypothetical protein CP335_27345, partial [Pseudomonas fluorescens]